MKKTKIVHAVALLLAVVAMLLPFATSFSVVTTAENGMSREEIVTCNYLDVALVERGFLFPMIVFGATILSAVILAVSFLASNRVIHIALLVFTATALVCALLPIVTQGLEFFTPTSLTITYLLVCTLVFSVQYVVGKYFRSPLEEEETE